MLEVSWLRPPGWMSCMRAGRWGGVAKAGNRKADFLHVAGSWRASPAQATVGRPSCQILWSVPTQTPEDSVAFLVSEMLNLWTFFFPFVFLPFWYNSFWVTCWKSSFSCNVTVPFIGKVWTFHLCSLWRSLAQKRCLWSPKWKKAPNYPWTSCWGLFQHPGPCLTTSVTRECWQSFIQWSQDRGHTSLEVGQVLKSKRHIGEPASAGLAICDSAFLFCTLASREARHVEIFVLQWIFF